MMLRKILAGIILATQIVLKYHFKNELLNVKWSKLIKNDTADFEVKLAKNKRRKTRESQFST